MRAMTFGHEGMDKRTPNKSVAVRLEMSTRTIPPDSRPVTAVAEKRNRRARPSAGEPHVSRLDFWGYETCVGFEIRTMDERIKKIAREIVELRTTQTGQNSRTILRTSGQVFRGKQPWAGRKETPTRGQAVRTTGQNSRSGHSGPTKVRTIRTTRGAIGQDSRAGQPDFWTGTFGQLNPDSENIRTRTSGQSSRTTGRENRDIERAHLTGNPNKKPENPILTTGIEHGILRR